MHVTRAVITAAAPDQSTLPLQRLVDRDGQEKTALQMILEEALGAGIEDVCLVICPGHQPDFEEAAGPHRSRLHFVEQDQPRGYGDALFRAREFVANRPFLHLVSDHLYLAHGERCCARQLVEAAAAENCAVSGVQATRESKLPYFGAVGGTPVANRPRLYEVTRVLEKPTPTRAEQELVVPGLRAGHYLCLFGMHVLTPAVMELLGAALATAGQGERLSLSPALAALAERERYLVLEVDGTRYNIGVQYGLWIAQLAVALAGQDREQVLAELVELLAGRR
jgi:UTP--glucose-1-phosphate uridylyltransferase